MIAMFLSILYLGPLYPKTWELVGLPVPAPADLEIGESGQCRVDTTGSFFYALSSRRQVSLRDGTSRYYSVFRHRKTQEHKEMFRISYDHLENEGWEPDQFVAFYYARGETLGGMLGTTTLSGVELGGYLLSRIGGQAHPYDEGIDPLLRLGLDWMTPQLGSDWKSPAIIHGDRSARLALPKELENAGGGAWPLINGVIWKKKVAYVRWDRMQGIGAILYKIDFADHPIVISVLPDLPPVTIYGWPSKLAAEFAECVLADASIVRSIANSQPEKLVEGSKGQLPHVYGTRYYDPHDRRWSFYEGLIVWGSSHDGRLVAFSLPPWRTLQVARVKE